MKRFLSILLAVFVIFALVGCEKVTADKGEKVTVLESGAGYLVVEYADGMVERLWSENAYSTFGIKPGTKLTVSSKENLELTGIHFGW